METSASFEARSAPSSYPTQQAVRLNLGILERLDCWRQDYTRHIAKVQEYVM